MTNETHVELTKAERKTFNRLYSGLVELQASVLYHVSEGSDNTEKACRAAGVAEALLRFRKEVLGDECSAGTVPCPDGSCAPPGGCGPYQVNELTLKGGDDE